MTAECDALRNEIQRLRQEIAGLNGRFIPISERQPIYEGIANAQRNADIAVTTAVLARTTAEIALATVVPLATTVAAIMALIPGFASLAQLNQLRRQVEVNSSGIDRLFGLLNTLNGRIQRNTERITSLEAFEIFVRAAIASLTSRVASVEELIAQVRVIANNALREAARAHSRIDELLSRLAAIERRITSLAVRISTLETDIRFIEQLLGGYLARITALESALSRLRSKVNKNARDIVNLSLKLDVLNALLTALDVLVAGALLTLAQLVSKVAQIAATLAGLLGQVTRALNLAERAIAAVERFSFELQQIRQVIERLAQQIRDLDGEENEMIEALLSEIFQIVGRNQELLQGEGEGELDLNPCVSQEESIVATYGGEGLGGLYSAVDAIAQSLNLIHTDTKCPPEATAAALPMHWEAKHGEIPQLIVIWRKTSGGGSSWSMTIPHPRQDIDKLYPFAFPPYTKGGNMASARLTDNSKVIVNTGSEGEAERIIRYVETLIDPSFIPSGGLQMTYSKNVANFLEVEIEASYIKKFAGHKNTAPLWGISLN